MAMIGTSSEKAWKLTQESKWLLFRNTTYVLQENEPKEKNKQKKEDNTPFYYSIRKFDTKGAQVHTPSGFGIIQDVKPNGVVVVRINKEKTEEFTKPQILYDIPISLKIASNAGYRDDKVIVPVNATSKDLIEKIELLLDPEVRSSAKVYFKGNEVAKTTESVEQLGVIPDCKMIALTGLGKLSTINRFMSQSSSWGYSTFSCDGITFSTNKDVKVGGFGVWVATNGQSLNATLEFQTEFPKSVLLSKEQTLVSDPNYQQGRIHRFLFDKPVTVKSGERHSCIVRIRNGNTYSGSSGQSQIQAEQGVVFQFQQCSESSNGTGVDCGQVPEIYYYP